MDVSVEMSPAGGAEALAQDFVGSLKNVNSMSAMDNPQNVNSVMSVDGSIPSVRGPARSLVTSVRNADGSVKKDVTDINPEDGQQGHVPARVSAWYHTTFNLL